MTSRLLTIVVVLTIGYVLGVKFPQLAAKVGLA
jgi:hypothetical protein